MGLIVQKFGGTSVANIDCIRRAAGRVQAAVADGHQVVVVVSAMAGATNQLLAWCQDLMPPVIQADSRDTPTNTASPLSPIEADTDADADSNADAVVASGEQITCGLMALALQQLGVPARSWQGWQLPIITTDSFSKAKIVTIQTDALLQDLAAGRVAVIAGFQGVTPDGRITTLGRGGSDLSAVALAAALHADRCDIYTDVDGVYTVDPRIVARASKLAEVTYEEMLEMASAGAKVLQTRSVAVAMKCDVPLQVLSSFTDSPGTFVVKDKNIMEHQVVTGLTYTRDEAKVTLFNVPDTPGIAANIFGPLAAAQINVDMIVQSVSPNGKSTDMTFTVAKSDLARSVAALQAIQDQIGFEKLLSDAEVVKVSVIGVGMRSHAGVAATMFAALADKGINIQVISTSEIKISVLIAEAYLELALRTLHTAYGLDADEIDVTGDKIG
jgi:aspartate kinase